MSKAITEQGNVMVPGCTGGGKTVFCAQTVQVFLARADVSQRREQYSGGAGEAFARAISENCALRVAECKEDGRHE